MADGRDVYLQSSDQVDVCLAEREMKRLFGDSRLELSPRNKAFLQYLAERYYVGNHARVKAYAVAIDVFGRPESFDPSLDPIVRIEAARLRAGLERYYNTHPDCSNVRVSLPRGYYVAEFSYVDASVCPSLQMLASHDDSLIARMVHFWRTLGLQLKKGGG